MTKQELLDLIAALFRQACGGLPKDWELVEEAVGATLDAAKEKAMIEPHIHCTDCGLPFAPDNILILWEWGRFFCLKCSEKWGLAVMPPDVVWAQDEKERAHDARD